VDRGPQIRHTQNFWHGHPPAMNWNLRSTSANDTENKTNREKTVKRNTHAAQILALNFECKIGHFFLYKSASRPVWCGPGCVREISPDSWSYSVCTEHLQSKRVGHPFATVILMIFFLSAFSARSEPPAFAFRRRNYEVVQRKNK